MTIELQSFRPLRARAHRAWLEVTDASLHIYDQIRQLVWADNAARFRTMLGLALLLLIVGISVAAVWITRYGEKADPIGAVQRTQATVQAGLPDSPLELTLSPDQLRSLSPEDARTVNAAIPISVLPNPPAMPFAIPTTPSSTVDFVRAVDCMTAAIYYEAAYESGGGQSGVAQVVLNRSRNAAYPGTVCGVVFQGQERQTGCQFSFTCDGALARLPDPVRWEIARSAAIAALSGVVAPAVGNATHYHADYVSPYWAPKLVKIGQIGAHIFYRWPGNAGLPGSFARPYTGGEPLIGKLGRLVQAGFGYRPAPSPETIDDIVAVAPTLVQPMSDLMVPPLEGALALPTLEAADMTRLGSEANDTGRREQAPIPPTRDPARPGAALATPPQRTNVRLPTPSNW